MIFQLYEIHDVSPTVLDGIPVSAGKPQTWTSSSAAAGASTSLQHCATHTLPSSHNLATRGPTSTCITHKAPAAPLPSATLQHGLAVTLSRQKHPIIDQFESGMKDAVLLKQKMKALGGLLDLKH